MDGCVCVCVCVCLCMCACMCVRMCVCVCVCTKYVYVLRDFKMMKADLSKGRRPLTLVHLELNLVSKVLSCYLFGYE